MAWKIIYGFDDIQSAIDAMDKDVRAKYFRITNLMVVEGSNLGMPYTEALGDGLYQIRAIGNQTTGRVIYCTLPGEQVVLLHAFVKKTEATPPKALEIAKERMGIVKADFKKSQAEAAKKGKLNAI